MSTFNNKEHTFFVFGQRRLAGSFNVGHHFSKKCEGTCRDHSDDGTNQCINHDSILHRALFIGSLGNEAISLVSSSTHDIALNQFVAITSGLKRRSAFQIKLALPIPQRFTTRKLK